MERGKIRITKDTIEITPVQGTVWLSQHQIADLLGVFVSKVNSNIRSILKSGVLREGDVMHTHRFDGGSVDLYNLEMVTALAFRCDSREAEIFRQWTMQRLTARERKAEPPVMICYGKGTLLC